MAPQCILAKFPGRCKNPPGSVPGWCSNSQCHNFVHHECASQPTIDGELISDFFCCTGGYGGCFAGQCVLGDECKVTPGGGTEQLQHCSKNGCLFVSHASCMNEIPGFVGRVLVCAVDHGCQVPEQQLNRGVINGIARLADPNRPRWERHQLIVDGYMRDDYTKPPMDRRSLEHLVDFLDDRDSHEVITELVLQNIVLSRPSDGGLDVLRGFFSRNDTTLTKVALKHSDLGSRADASRLFAAFHTNRTISDLAINSIRNLRGAALGNSLCGLMQNMQQLQRLDYSGLPESFLRVEGVRALQPALQANRTLKILNLYWCEIGDEGLRLLVDALVGNTTMDVLIIGSNLITSNGLDDITRLIDSTRLKTIDIGCNFRVFSDEASTQRFARILSRHEFLKELCLSHCRLGDTGIRIIVDSLVGNTTMEVLDIDFNDITSKGLADITRLLESTQLKTINFPQDRGVFNDVDAAQHFVSTLQQKKSSVQELPWIIDYDFPVDSDTAMLAIINNSLTRNQQLNRVNLLLAPPPPPQQQHQRDDSWTASLIMLKTWHKAIAKFAMVPNNLGASAIFKLFQARPALLEKRLKRPPPADAAAVSQEQKCRRL